MINFLVKLRDTSQVGHVQQRYPESKNKQGKYKERSKTFLEI
jgi:hypothetical protein